MINARIIANPCWSSICKRSSFIVLRFDVSLSLYKNDGSNCYLICKSNELLNSKGKILVLLLNNLEKLVRDSNPIEKQFPPRKVPLSMVFPLLFLFVPWICWWPFSPVRDLSKVPNYMNRTSTDWVMCCPVDRPGYFGSLKSSMVLSSFPRIWWRKLH